MASLSAVTPAGINNALEHFLLQSVDGIVVIVPHEAMLKSLRAIHLAVPLVAVGFSADERLTVVAVNQRAGAALAVEHLVNLGHTAIAHISGPRDWIDAAARADGWRRTLQQAGLRAAVLTEGDWSAESGYLAGLELAAAGNVTAVFAANDQMALGALRAFGEAGLRVPEDISIVGFDDQPEAAYFVPPLTSVNQGFAELGARCIQMLLSDMAGGRSEAASVLNPKLVVRASTAAPGR